MARYAHAERYAAAQRVNRPREARNPEQPRLRAMHYHVSCISTALFLCSSMHGIMQHATTRSFSIVRVPPQQNRAIANESGGGHDVTSPQKRLLWLRPCLQGHDPQVRAAALPRPVGAWLPLSASSCPAKPLFSGAVALSGAHSADRRRKRGAVLHLFAAVVGTRRGHLPLVRRGIAMRSP